MIYLQTFCLPNCYDNYLKSPVPQILLNSKCDATIQGLRATPHCKDMRLTKLGKEVGPHGADHTNRGFHHGKSPAMSYSLPSQPQLSNAR